MAPRGADARRRRRHQRRHLVHDARPRDHDGRAARPGGPAQRGDPRGDGADDRQAGAAGRRSSTRGGTPDYFGGTPNWATSPRLRKFVDSLPGVGAGAANDLGQYIPVAVPDTTTYPGSDYYEIAVRQFSEQLHSDLPATRLRGYVQLNDGTDADGRNTVRAGAHPLPRAADRRARKRPPVRVKFVNQLPAGDGRAISSCRSTPPSPAPGRGPLGGDETYPQNRASLHLHGGLTPWISGGTPYQWITPAGEHSPYASARPHRRARHVVRRRRQAVRGHARSHQRPGPGRHDAVLPQRPERPLPLPARRHLRADAAERVRGRGGAVLHRRPGRRRARRRQRRRAGVRPGHRRGGQGRHDPGRRAAAASSRTRRSSRTSSSSAPRTPPGTSPAGAAGRALVSARLHAESERVDVAPNADINAKGRWDYLPWYWKGYDRTENGPVANPLVGTAAYEPTQNPGTPNPSAVPNAFFDTMLVNGTAYPYARVERKAYRLRILNACGDRPSTCSSTTQRRTRSRRPDPEARPSCRPTPGRVPMLAAVGAASGRLAGGWPTDGRAGRGTRPARRRPRHDPDRQRRRPAAAGGGAAQHAGRLR